MEISADFSKEILSEATSLRQRYGVEGLLDLLEGEQRRLKEGQALTLSGPRDLIDGVTQHISDLVISNYSLTKAIFASYVVENTINYLVAQGVIDALNLSKDKFIIMLVVGIILDKIKDVWEANRSSTSTVED